MEKIAKKKLEIKCILKSFQLRNKRFAQILYNPTAGNRRYFQKFCCLLVLLFTVNVISRIGKDAVHF